MLIEEGLATFGKLHEENCEPIEDFTFSHIPSREEKIEGLLCWHVFLNPLLGMAAGMGAGAVTGALTDIGINDKFMKDLASGLTPGSSALFVLVRKSTPDKVLEELRGTGGKILKTSLTHEDETKLQDALKCCQIGLMQVADRFASYRVAKTKGNGALWAPVREDGHSGPTLERDSLNTGEAQSNATVIGLVEELTAALRQQSATGEILQIINLVCAMSSSPALRS